MRAVRFAHRRSVVIVSAIAVAAAMAAIAVAQSGTAPPTLAYSLGTTGAPTGPTTAAPGSTQFTITNTGSKDVDFTVVKIHDGTDPATFAALAGKKLSADEIDNAPFDIVGGTGDAVKGRPSSFVITLLPGNYAVLNTTSEKSAPYATLTVSGDPNGATAPSPSTIIGMYDYKYKLSKHISRSGAIRVSNKGKRIHMAIALKAANKASAEKLSKALRKGDRNAFKLVRGGGSSLDPISPGQSVVLPAVHYGKGSYVFACFWESKASKGKEHTVLGMTKVFTVK